MSEDDKKKIIDKSLNRVLDEVKKIKENDSKVTYLPSACQRVEDRRKNQKPYEGTQRRKQNNRENPHYIPDGVELDDLEIRNHYKEELDALRAEKAELYIPHKEKVLYYSAVGLSGLYVLATLLITTILKG